MKKTAIVLAIICIFMVSFSVQVHTHAIEECLCQMFDAHGSVMLLIDPETGTVEYANQAAAGFYGYTAEELQGMPVREITTLNEEETAAIMEAALAREKNFFTFQHRLANGETRDVEVHAYPYLAGEREMLFSIIHDITTETRLAARNRLVTTALLITLMIVIVSFIAFNHLRTRNLEVLRRKNDEINNFNELRRRFFTAIDGLIYLKDENLQYVFVNKGVERFHQRTEAEIVGRDDYALSPAEFADKIRKTDLAVLQEQALVVDQVEWGNRVLKTTKFPVRLINGNYGVGAYIQDVTAEYNKQRKEEKRLLRNAILVDILRKNFSSTEEQLDYALHEALKLTESKYGYIYLYDEETREFNLNSWSREVMDECKIVDKQTKYQLEKTGLWGEVVRQRKPIIVNDYQAPHPLKKGYPGGHVPITRFMSIPVLVDGRIVAVLGLANKEEDYDQDDIHQVTLLMNGVWQAKEKREATEKLALERKKYFLTLLSIGDGVMVVDREGKIEILNEVAQKLTGWSAQEAVGRHYREVFVLTHEKEGHTVKDPIAEVFATNRVQKLDNHAVLISRDGKRYHLEDSAAPIKGKNDKTMGAVLVFRDVTEEKEQRKKIEYLSFHDPLTGLYNRRFIEAKLRELDTEDNLPLSIICGDVNGLKLANDIFGHVYGDQLLKKTAEVFQGVLRSGDIIARWGGDEFLVLLPKTGPQEAGKIITRIKERFAREHIRSIQGSISLGYATKNNMGEKIGQVLMQAEDAMYTEKSLERASTDRRMLRNLLTTFHEDSPQEKGHAERVGQLCRNFGLKLELPPEEIERLVEAGFLHDLGKTVLDGELLNKVGALTDQEWSQEKRHPVVGCRILKLFDQTLDLAEIVLAHHERWDGTGYPQGLKGEEIPKLARIITLAEAYDALTSGFYSGNPLGKTEALAIIEAQAGSQFDPQLVPVFSKLVTES